MFYILSEEANDYSVIEGISKEDSEKINENGWSMFCAPRPLAYIWFDEDGEVVEGFRGWDANVWHYAAGDMAGILNNMGNKCLLDSWASDDAEPVKVVDYETLEGLANGVLHNDPEYIEPSIEYFGKETWAINVLRNARWKVADTTGRSG